VCVTDGWARWPHLSPTGRGSVCICSGALNIFHAVFRKRNKRGFSRFTFKPLEIYNLVILSPNWVNQILLGFLWVDLHDKIIRFHFCDTFLYSFI
jgi:hypothetical protein